MVVASPSFPVSAPGKRDEGVRDDLLVGALCVDGDSFGALPRGWDTLHGDAVVSAWRGVDVQVCHGKAAWRVPLTKLFGVGQQAVNHWVEYLLWTNHEIRMPRTTLKTS